MKDDLFSKIHTRLKELDKNKDGHVPSSKFRKVMENHGFSRDTVNVITRNFGKAGKIAYEEFLNVMKETAKYDPFFVH